MADNVAITAGSGTAIAADEVTDATLGSCKVQYVKLMDGTLDSTNKAVIASTGHLQTEDIASVAPGTTAPAQVIIVGGKSSDATAQYQPLPLSPGGASVFVQGLPGGIAFTGITGTGAQAAQACDKFNVATLTLRTFTGTTPSVTFKLQASDDNTNWVDLQGINNSSGLTGVLWTQAAALAGGTAGPSIDYTLGAYTYVRVNITAISGTSATAAFGLQFQTMPYEASPGAICNGTDGTGINRILRTDAAGIQVVKNFSSDVPRTLICIYCDDITGVASETVLSCSVNKAGAVTTAQTSYTVSSGKTLRIMGMSVYVTGTTTTAAGAKVRVRQAASSVGATSPIIATLGAGMPAAVATASGANNAQWEPGIEVAAGQQICLSQLATSISSKVSAMIVGFEY